MAGTCPTSPTGSTPSVPSSDCAICWNSISKKAVLDSCHHEFHLECIKQWTEDHNSCPNCRQIYKYILFQVEANGQFQSMVAERRGPPFIRSANLLLSIAPGIVLSMTQIGYNLINCRVNRLNLVISRPDGEITFRKTMSSMTGVHLEAIRSDEVVKVRDTAYPIGPAARIMDTLRESFNVVNTESIGSLLSKFKMALSIERWSRSRAINRTLGLRTETAIRTRERTSRQLDVARLPVPPPFQHVICCEIEVAPSVSLELTETGCSLFTDNTSPVGLVINRPDGGETRLLLRFYDRMHFVSIGADVTLELGGRVYPVSPTAVSLHVLQEVIKIESPSQSFKPASNRLASFLCFSEDMLHERQGQRRRSRVGARHPQQGA